MINFHCHNCQKKIGVEDACVGRKVKCPGCGAAVAVPHLPAEDSPAPTPAVARPAGLAPASRRNPSIERIGLSVLVVVALTAIIFGNSVTRLFFVLVVLTTLYGYWLGASKVAAVFGGMLATVVLAVPAGKAFESPLGSALGLSGLAGRIGSIAIVGLIEVVVVSAVLQIIIGRVVKQRPAWRRYDRLAGSGLGLLEGALLGFVSIWAVLSLGPIAATSLVRTEGPEGAARSNPAARCVVAVAALARRSGVGRLANALNPLDELRLIALCRKGLIVLNDPVTRDAFVSHHAIQGIKRRPSVRQALDRLSADPETRRIIESEAGITAEDLRTILNSPTLLSILDETGLVTELSPIADDLEQAIDEALERVSPEPRGD